jgi:hypothetical protein
MWEARHTYTSATQVALGSNASTTVSGAQVVVNPYTTDGTHPSQYGHIQAAIALAASSATAT